jgi:teichuronic acid biosynthesis glycosyltransferase TuaG
VENKLISIVIPSYNSKKYIELTINSVKNQTYQKWELIIIDDCSNDGTQEFVSNIILNDSRIKLIKLDKNSGAPATPRNIGIHEAKGYWIAFLDSDDIWHPKKLELQIALMDRYKVKFSSTGSINFQDESEICFSSELNEISIQNISYLMQRIKGRIPNSSVMVEKSLLLKYPLNENLRYRAVEDYDCWLRIHKEIKISIKLQEGLLFYRIIEGQISGNKFQMIKKVYMIHFIQSSNIVVATLLTITHIVGGIWYRFKNSGF